MNLIKNGTYSSVFHLSDNSGNVIDTLRHMDRIFNKPNLGFGKQLIELQITLENALGLKYIILSILNANTHSFDGNSLG